MKCEASNVSTFFGVNLQVSGSQIKYNLDSIGLFCIKAVHLPNILSRRTFCGHLDETDIVSSEALHISINLRIA